MVKVGLFAKLHAKPGQEAALQSMLEGALALANQALYSACFCLLRVINQMLRKPISKRLLLCLFYRKTYFQMVLIVLAAVSGWVGDPRPRTYSRIASL